MSAICNAQQGGKVSKVGVMCQQVHVELNADKGAHEGDAGVEVHACHLQCTAGRGVAKVGVDVSRGFKRS